MSLPSRKSKAHYMLSSATMLVSLIHTNRAYACAFVKSRGAPTNCAFKLCFSQRSVEARYRLICIQCAAQLSNAETYASKQACRTRPR